MSNDFEGRLAVVTGASSGIGLAVTARLLAQGARVLAMSRKMGGLEELARHFAGELTWVSGDVTKAEDLEQLAQNAARLGPVHYLVPNAGIAELADCLDLQAFDRQWAVNGAGALNTLAARANFTGRAITTEFAQETLRDLLRAQQQAISIPNIQKTVADYYGLQIKDLLSKRRTRSLARPRQVAMALAKELTEHSLPEIGDAFAGRDHTTVLHACRQIRTLMEADGKLREDWDKLIRKLSE